MCGRMPPPRHDWDGCAVTVEKLKVLCVFGTRPEAIKMAPVVKELRRHSDRLEPMVCVTAEHRLLLDQVLQLFDIQPDYDLNIILDDQTLTDTTVSVLTKVGDVLERETPDWVLVQGDTTTAMAAALASFYRKIPVGHVEAGLRTWDKLRPYPEEVNRKTVDAVSGLLFAPTEVAKANLLREGTPESSILVTGNTVIDALLDMAAREYDFERGPLARIPFANARIILVTAHRRENFGGPLRNICLALRDIATMCPDVHIVYPVHPHRNVWEPVHSMLSGASRVALLEPMDYLSFVHLMKHSHLILTDSGGLQEEAPSLGVPVLVLRDVTERPEAVAAGTAVVVGTQRDAIVEGARRLLEDAEEYQSMARTVNPYGDGRASRRIVRALTR
jgi:UDP-N-acetylglucosamine 2-epimerase (non-hydrolysing)